jgi:hypothetical protein
MQKLIVVVLFLFVLSGKFSYEIFNTEFQVRYFILISLIVLSFRPELIYSNLQKTTSINGVIAFCATLILSAGWNMEGSYVLEYIFDLFILIYSIILVNICLKNKKEIFLFIGLFEKTAFIYSVLSLASVLVGERGSLLLGGPNVTVRVIFLGILCHIQLRQNHNYNYFIICIFILGIIATGSRGGMISSLICLIFYVIHALSLKSFLEILKIRFTGLIKLIFVIAAFFLIYNDFSEQIDFLINSRITETLVNKIHLAGRDDLLIASFKVIGENVFFGQGLASYYDNEVGFYPHNLFVQLYLDVGLFALINVAVILYALSTYYTNRKSILFYAIPFYCVAHLVSGSYYDLRYMFIFWALGEILTKNKLITKT